MAQIFRLMKILLLKCYSILTTNLGANLCRTVLLKIISKILSDSMIKIFLSPPVIKSVISRNLPIISNLLNVFKKSLNYFLLSKTPIKKLFSLHGALLIFISINLSAAIISSLIIRQNLPIQKFLISTLKSWK